MALHGPCPAASRATKLEGCYRMRRGGARGWRAGAGQGEVTRGWCCSRLALRCLRRLLPPGARKGIERDGTGAAAEPGPAYWSWWHGAATRWRDLAAPRRGACPALGPAPPCHTRGHSSCAEPQFHSTPLHPAPPPLRLATLAGSSSSFFFFFKTFF